MTKNGCSEFFLTIFQKKDWYKFRIAKNAHSKFNKTFLVQKDWKKFGMAKILAFSIYLNLSSAKRLEEIWNYQNYAFQIY